jgi:mono/diheme cytochrome c family protein
MKKIIFSLFFLGALVFTVQSCGSGGTTPAADTANKNASVSASTDGQSLYTAKCTACHGADGKAGVMGAADLSSSKLEHDAACAIVKNGKNLMKSFGSDLNDAQIDAVVKFAEGLRK